MEVINREFQTVVNYMKKHQNDGRMNGYREMLLITWPGISSLSRWYLNGESISLYFSMLMYPVFSIRQGPSLITLFQNQHSVWFRESAQQPCMERMNERAGKLVEVMVPPPWRPYALFRRMWSSEPRSRQVGPSLRWLSLPTSERSERLRNSRYCIRSRPQN